MNFFKHVGTANKKKVVIVQRELPGEEHMAAVLYSEILPPKYHDDVMTVLQSTEGQACGEFREVLQRRMMTDGTNMLHSLALEGYLKKVPSANVMVTPNSKSAIRLDELNDLLRKAGQGEQAAKRLGELDRQQGYASKPEANQAAGDQVVNTADNLSRVAELRAEAARIVAEADALEAISTPAKPKAKPRRSARKPRVTATA